MTDNRKIVPGARVRVRGTYHETVLVPTRKGGSECRAVLTGIVDVDSGIAFRDQHFRCGPIFDRLGLLNAGDQLEFDARVELRRTLTPRQEKRSALLPPAEVYRLLNPAKLVRVSRDIDGVAQASDAGTPAQDAFTEPVFHGSTTLERRWRDALRPHPLNQQIYGDHADDALVDSVRRLGVQSPLLVTRDGMIIAGHRRWEAACRGGPTQVPVIVVDHDDELDLIEMLVESNRQRIKSNEQLGREARALHRVETQRAKRRQAEAAAVTNAQRRGDALPPIPAEASAAGEAREKVARALGIGKQKAEEARQVVDVIDQLEVEDKQRDAEHLRETLNTKSVHAAHEAAKQAGYLTHATGDAVVPGEPAPGYSVVYVHPPWPTGSPDDPSYNAALAACRAAFSCRRLAKASAENAILFVAVTNTALMHAMKLISSCGFQYRQHVVVVRSSTMGLAPCDHHAMLIIATRGSAPPEIRLESSILPSPGDCHEEQAAIFGLIDRVAAGARVLQAFGTPARTGWATLSGESLVENVENVELMDAS